MIKSILLLIFCNILVFSQQFSISGKVTDGKTGQPLSFANIRVLNSTYGTSANRNGRYELKLQNGNYKLVASFIGYISDTVKVDNLNEDKSGLNFSLAETDINLPEIVVHPGENPADRIIKLAIMKKNEREKKLNSYEFEAYTKGIIKTTDEIETKSSNVNLGLDKTDSTDLKITGILENRSKGYFKKPDLFKDVIIARKQSSNFSSSINTITGGRLLENFYENNLNFFGKPLPGPLTDNALQYYYFYIQSTAAMDNQKVYQIHIAPETESDPGFTGSIFITDSTYNLIKVDLQLNRAANVGGLFDTINIFQQFSPFSDSIYMPIDYRLFVKANILGLAKIGFELNTILYNYSINPEISDDFFDKAIITVLPEADKKDSTYWKNTQTIPNTPEEQAAYRRIDSISRAPRTFWDDFSFLSTRINLSRSFSVSAPLTFYHFNRIEGNALDFGMFLDDALNSRLNSSLKLTYGFADKKVKEDFSFNYLLGIYRTFGIKFNAFNKLVILFGQSEDYNELTSTILALISKYDFRDYYYTKGLNFL